MATDKQTWCPNANQPAGIVLADGQPVVLRGLESILAGEHAFLVREVCTNGDDALGAVRRHRPDILILDLRLPDQDGLALLAEIAESGLMAKSIVFTDSIDEDQMCEAIRLGVRGVLLKNMEPPAILQCLRKVCAGSVWLERQAVGLALERLLCQDAGYQKRGCCLARHELEVARLVAKGLANKTVADTLNLSEHSVKTYLRRIYEKLCVSNRVGLTVELKNKGLV